MSRSTRAVSESRPLTKELFAAGLQCCKRLYLDYHHPEDIPAPSPARAHLLEVGRQLVELACQAFPNGQQIDRDDMDKAVEQTAAALASDQPVALFDAAFRHGRLEVRADIVLRSPSGGLDLFEVKSGTKVKTRHVKDVAFQVFTIEKNGHSVDKTTLLHLNSQYRHQGGNRYPVHKLFKHVDVTEKVRRHVERVGEQIERFENVLEDPHTLELPTGTWCHAPFTCGYLDDCLRDAGEHPLIDLPELTRDLEYALHEEGIEDLTQIEPDREGLSSVQRRALRAIRENRLIVEDFVGRELRDVEFPLHFVHVATQLQVLPLLEGGHPWQHIPFGWTDVVLHDDGRREVQSHIADGKGDPRPEFVTSLARATRDEGTLMLWGSTFEQRIRQLLEDLTEEKPDIRALLNAPRFDLLQLVKAGVQHPGFGASFDLMRVHAALTGASPPRVAKGEIADDAEASMAFQRLTNPRTRATTRKKITAQLESWSRRQSEAVLAVFEALLEASAE